MRRNRAIYRTIGELLKKHKVSLILMILFSILLILIGLAETEIGRRIINLISRPVSGGGGPRRLLLLCAGLAAAGIASVGGEYGSALLFSRFTQAFVGDLRLRVFHHVLQLPQEFFNKNSINQIISRLMGEAGSIGGFFAQVFVYPVMKIFMVIFYGLYLFQLNWRLAIAGILFIPLYAFIIPRDNRKIQKLTEESIDSAVNMAGHVQEVFNGIAEVRAGQTYFFEGSRLRRKLGECVEKNFRTTKASGGHNALMKAVSRIAPIALYIYGGSLCLKGDMTAGTVVASIAVVNTLYGQVVAIMSFLTEWSQVRVRLNKLEEYLGLETENRVLPSGESGKAPAGDVVFDGVSFGFTEDQILLNDIHFKAASGEKVAFVGPSGSGKSLTAALLGTVYKPLRGDITIGGERLGAVPMHGLRKKIGFVQQTPFLFNDTIRNNILYAALRKPQGESDRMETWVDFSLFDDIATMEALDRRILEAVKDVGLLEDIIAIGMRSRPKREGGRISEADQSGILQARSALRQEIARLGDDGFEPYREDRFLEYGTVIENIAFCPTAAITDRFGSLGPFWKKHLRGPASERGLAEDLFRIGLQLARTDALLLEKLDKDQSPLLHRLELDKHQIDSRRRINEKLAPGGDSYARVERGDPALAEEIIELALKHCPGRSKEDVLGEPMRRSILELRKAVRSRLPEKAIGPADFFGGEAFNPSLSLRENIVYGNIDPSRKKANEEIDASIQRLLREAGLEELAVRLGLDFQVGDRGSKLSGGQRQKVVIARILLKNPSLLILDEATASLDAVSQTRIQDLVAEKYGDRTVISIAHRLSTIKDCREILVFDKGRIVERGTYEGLLEMKGLFYKLSEGSR